MVSVMCLCICVNNALVMNSKYFVNLRLAS